MNDQHIIACRCLLNIYVFERVSEVQIDFKLKQMNDVYVIIYMDGVNNR